MNLGVTIGNSLAILHILIKHLLRYTQFIRPCSGGLECIVRPQYKPVTFVHMKVDNHRFDSRFHGSHGIGARKLIPGHSALVSREYNYV